MSLSSVDFGIDIKEKIELLNNFVPITSRYNSLSDMDFNIIADTIRCQNLKNQMNIRLMNLKRSLSNSN